jgi:hypothetical protein
VIGLKILKRPNQFRGLLTCLLRLHYTLKISAQTGYLSKPGDLLLVGDEIIMTFQLEGLDDLLKVKGEIAHATRAGVWVEFKEIGKYIDGIL